MAAILRHDPRALATLHAACSTRAHAVALRIVRRDEIAAEVVADTFWQVWREAARFDRRRGSVMAWIATITRSRAIDAMRHVGSYARHEVPLEDDELAARPLASPQRPLVDLLADRERDATLRRLLERLPAAPRQALVLAYVHGLSHEEIARHSGLPLGTVKARIRRGLALLRDCCGQSGFTA